jgi:hypothetical protein
MNKVDVIAEIFSEEKNFSFAVLQRNKKVE